MQHLGTVGDDMSGCYLTYNAKNELLEVECDRRDSRKLKRVGALRWNPSTQRWLFGFTLYNVQAIQNEFDEIGADDETCDRLVALEEQERKVRKIQREDDKKKRERLFTALGIDIDVGSSLRVPGLKLKLRAFQKRGTIFAVRRGSSLILDEMGLGKTVEAIAYALFMKHYRGAKSCLVVVLAGIKYNWRDEIEKFCNEECTIIEGSVPKRREAWKSDAFFKVISYETFISDMGLRKRPARKGKKSKGKTARLAPRSFDVVMLDEAHKIKNRTSIRARAVKTIKAKYRLGLTGTPIDGQLVELHSIMEFICNGVFPSKTEFVKRYCKTDWWGKVTGYKNLKEVRRRMRPYYIRRTKREVAPELPDKVISTVHVELTPSEREVYERYKAEALREDSEINRLALVTRFKQICDSPALVGEDVVSSKLSMFTELVDEIVLNGRKVLAFSQYEEMCKLIIMELEKRGFDTLHIYGGVSSKQRQEFVKQFTEDDSKPLLICTDAGSHGLNIQLADYVVHYDDSWSPSVMGQREDRSHRIGRRGVVSVVRFVTVDTIEERVLEVLSRKVKLQKVLGLGDEVVVNKLSLQQIKGLI